MDITRLFLIKIIDTSMSLVTTRYPKLIPVYRILFHFPLHWRLLQAAKELASYERLPPAAWKDIPKHGNNVVYGPESKMDANIIFGLWVVDYTNKTRRIVFGLPSEVAKVGKTF